MIVAGLKLGGIERGGNSLNVVANFVISSITPYIAADVVDAASPRTCWT